MSEQEKERRPQYVSMTESGAHASDIKTTIEVYMEGENDNLKKDEDNGTDETV